MFHWVGHIPSLTGRNEGVVGKGGIIIPKTPPIPIHRRGRFAHFFQFFGDLLSVGLGFG